MLIQLTVTKRGTKNIASVGQAFLVSDITSPIVAKTIGIGSVVTVRENRGPAAGTNESLQVVYEVTETLAQIAAMTSELFLAPVISQDGRAATGDRVFNFGYIVDTVIPMPNPTNSTFLLREEGKPRPTSWVVAMTVAAITAVSSSGGGGGSSTPIKLQARLAPTIAVNIAVAIGTYDQVPANIDDRIFLTHQIPGEDNGMYIYNGPGVPMTRSLDMNVSSQVKAGMLVVVTEGVDNEDVVFELITNDPIILGTTPLSFARTTLLPIISKTVAQMQTLSSSFSLRPFQFYKITDAAFQGATVPFYVKTSDDGVSIEPNGYFVSAGVLYPASYDLTNDLMLSFTDLVRNNKISRSVGGGYNCVDKVPLGNVQFANINGHEFNMTNDLDPGNALSNVNIYPGALVMLKSGTQINGGTFGFFSTFDSGAGETFSQFEVGAGGSVVLGSGASVIKLNMGDGASFHVSGGSHTDNTLGENAAITSVNNAELLQSRIGNASTVILNGPAGGGQVARILRTVIGENSVVIVGDTGSNTTMMDGCEIGNSVFATINNTTQFVGCVIGNGKTITVSDGAVYANKSFINGYSNFPGTLNITSGKKLTINYAAMVGGPYQVGEVVTDLVTTGTGVVVSDDGAGSMVVDTLTGFLKAGNGLNGGTSGAASVISSVVTADKAVVVPYDTLIGGPPVFGELVTNMTTGANGILVADSGTELILQGVTCPYVADPSGQNILAVPPFSNNDNLAFGTSGAAALVNGVTVYNNIEFPANTDYVAIWTLAFDNNFAEMVDLIKNSPTNHNFEIQIPGTLAGGVGLYPLMGSVSAPANDIMVAQGNQGQTGYVLFGQWGDCMEFRKINGEVFNRQNGLVKNYQ